MKTPTRHRNAPRLNRDELATICVTGRIVSPQTKGSSYRIGQDGGLRVLPGSGGITLSHRIGDRCVGLAADHLEPAISIKNTERIAGGVMDAANRALNVLACIGNAATVVSGPAMGANGIVTGKHGGVAHVMIDFPDAAMRKMRIGDLIQVKACGQGLRLRDFPDLAVMNCAPDLIDRLGLRIAHDRIALPATHLVPAGVMGSGLGKSSAARGDYDIQLFDARLTRRFRLDTLRFGDFVVIGDADGRYGRSYATRHITYGIVVHSDSTVAGHGPGVTTLISGPARHFDIQRNPHANLAKVYQIRPLAEPVRGRTFVAKTQHLRPRLSQIHQRHIAGS